MDVPRLRYLVRLTYQSCKSGLINEAVSPASSTMKSPAATPRDDLGKDLLGRGFRFDGDLALCRREGLGFHEGKDEPWLHCFREANVGVDRPGKMGAGIVCYVVRRRFEDLPCGAPDLAQDHRSSVALLSK
jgi:hypothetical protein